MVQPLTTQPTQSKQNCWPCVSREISNIARTIAILAAGILSGVMIATTMPPPLVPGALLTITLVTLIALLPDSEGPIGRYDHYRHTYYEPVHHFIRDVPRTVIHYAPDVVRHVPKVVHHKTRSTAEFRATADEPTREERVPVGERRP